MARNARLRSAPMMQCRQWASIPTSNAASGKHCSRVESTTTNVYFEFAASALSRTHSTATADASTAVTW